MFQSSSASRAGLLGGDSKFKGFALLCGHKIFLSFNMNLPIEYVKELTMTNQAKPTKEKVYLAQMQREVVLNFITMRDDEWMADKYGVEKLSSAFVGETLDIDVIFGIFFRVLTKEDKEAILKVKVYEDHEMTVREVEFTDPVQKLKAIISGQKEITDIILALTHTRMKSNPAVVEALKKKAIENQNSETHSDGNKPRT